MKSKSRIKFLCFVIVLLQSITSFAQREAVELEVTQPSPLANIRLLYDKYNLIAGQSYTIIVQNLSNKNLHIKGQLVAVLVCGNEVSTTFDEVIKPSEKRGGEAFLSDGTGMTGIVTTKDCEKFEIVLNDKGKEEHNRIRTIKLINYSSVAEKTEEERAAEERQKQLAIEKKQQEAQKTEDAEKQKRIADIQQQEKQRQQEVTNRQRQEQYETRMRELNKQLVEQQKTNADIANTFSQGVKEISDMLIEKRRKEAALAEQQRISNEMAQLKAEKERADQKEVEDAKQKIAYDERQSANQIEQKKIADNNANVEMWRNKALNIIAENLIDYTKIKKANQISDESIKSVFYVIWNFETDQNQILIANPIEIKRDGDGDWPLSSEIDKKIQTQSKLFIYQTPDKIRTSDNSLCYLLGCFTQANDAAKVIDEIKANAIKKGINVITFDNPLYGERLKEKIQQNSGLKYFHLRGQVKSIEEKLVKDSKTLSTHNVIFNPGGMILSDKTIDAAGNLMWECGYKLNESNEIDIVSNTNSKNPSYSSEQQLLYNPEGLVIEWNTIGQNGEITFKTRAEYDSKGFMISLISTNGNNVASVYTYINNENGDPVKISFDSNTTYLNYEYDENNNWTKRTSLSVFPAQPSLGGTSVTNRTILYY